MLRKAYLRLNACNQTQASACSRISQIYPELDLHTFQLTSKIERRQTFDDVSNAIPLTPSKYTGLISFVHFYQNGQSELYNGKK